MMKMDIKKEPYKTNGSSGNKNKVLKFGLLKNFYSRRNVKFKKSEKTKKETVVSRAHTSDGFVVLCSLLTSIWKSLFLFRCRRSHFLLAVAFENNHFNGNICSIEFLI